MPTRTIHTQPKPAPAVPPRTDKPLTPERVCQDLIALPFPDYVARVALLMSRMGYHEVRPLGPLYEKGRNAHGGHDIQATYAQDLARFAAIAQAKQYAQPVPRCFVDELRGAMLRIGARQGLLFTTSSFAPSAVEAAQAGQQAAPVQLVAGKELARLMIAYGVAAGSFTAPPVTEANQEKARPGRILARRSGPRHSYMPPEGHSTTAGDAGDCPGVSVTILVRMPSACSRTSRFPKV